MKAAATLICSVVLASTAFASGNPVVVRHRISLPTDGRAVDLSPYSHGQQWLEVALVGTLTNGFDGSEIDAWTAHTPALQANADGPFVVVPHGSVLLSSDGAAHRYVLRMPTSGPLHVSVNVPAIANRHLVTFSEAAQQLTGAIFVEVLGTAPAPVLGNPQAASVQPVPLPGFSFAALGGLLGFPLLAGAGVFLHRRRSRREQRYRRRARLALKAIEHEVQRLGPAFEDVLVSARRLVDRTEQVHDHIGEIQAALKRTAWTDSSGALSQRDKLRTQLDQAMNRLQALSGRLEETAARLASHGTSQRQARDVDSDLSSLTRDIQTAIDADEEANEAA